MAKRFKTGSLVVRSDHWRREHCQPNDYQLGIVTELHYENERGNTVCYPVIHWEGTAMAHLTHPNNADVTTWQAVTQR